jgi:hypothetical protein
MKTPTVILISLLVTSVLHAQQAGAPPNSEPLATIHLAGGGGIASVNTGVALRIIYYGFQNSPLFANVVWTPDMLGQSFFDTAGSEAGYDNFLSLLTDGTNERVGHICRLSPYGGGNGFAGWETTSFTTHPSDWNGIDLQGYSITGVELTLNQLSIVSPGSDPNGNGNWTDYSFDATLKIYTLPEPVGLFPVAIACFCGVRSWQASQRRHPGRGSKLQAN